MVQDRKNRQRGEGMVSYLIVLALVVLVCVTAAQFLGGSISGLFGKTGKKVEQLGEKVDKIKVQ